MNEEQVSTRTLAWAALILVGIHIVYPGLHNKPKPISEWFSGAPRLPNPDVRVGNGGRIRLT